MRCLNFNTYIMINRVVIKKGEVLESLYKFSPEFRKIVFMEYDEEERQLEYIIVGRYAKFLVDRYKDYPLTDFSREAEFIENLLLQDDSYVRELATIGFLEGIQNIWGNNDVDPNQFYKYLLPEGRKWWKELERFWNGEVKYVGETFDGEV